MIQTKYRYIAKEKGYRSGMARMKVGGPTVAGIIIMQSNGDSLENIVEAYPMLTKEMLEEALVYSKENKEEINRDIYDLTHLPDGYRLGPNGIVLKK